MMILLLSVLPQAAEIVVDTTVQKPISPYIYGTNHPFEANNPKWSAFAKTFTVARQGGNRMTAYNWETNASNAGNDYRHQNDGYMGESNEPGKTVSDFFKSAAANGSVTILTVPAAGYVSADKGPDGDVNKTPDYLNKRFHRSLASKPGGKYSLKPDTTDKVVYQDEFVNWVEHSRSAKHAVWYSVDNEPDLWHSTHERIVPQNVGYAGILKVTKEFSAAIKKVAPKALTLGPASYGWQGFRTFQNAPDAAGRDFLDFYLQEMKKAETESKRRLLDILDIHWYPEARGGGLRVVEGQTNAGVTAARIQAPRSLWDTSYVEESWISDTLGKKPIGLLPRTFAQIAQNYPGTKLGITEYDFGGHNDPSGTVAQADVLGIFGRYGVFTACHWGISPQRPAQIAGFGAFSNFDGKGAKFGDRSLAVSGEKPEANSVYASLSSNKKGRVTLVAVNKLATSQEFRLRFPRSQPKSSKGYLANPTNPYAPSSLATKITGSGVTFTLPAYGVGTVELN